jgi:serine/threonine protein phosphatase PrpC
MNCTDLQDDHGVESALEALVQGRMKASYAAAVGTHLASCDECLGLFAHHVGRSVVAMTGRELRSGRDGHLVWSAASCRGKRSAQEDRWLVVAQDGVLLAAVMDGVGSGRRGGDAAEVVRRELAKHPALTREALESALSNAAWELGTMVGATTATVLLLDSRSRRAWKAHVGDSGLLRVAPGLFERETDVHRYDRHVLSAWLGDGEYKAPAVVSFPYPRVGERLLLGTDGVLDTFLPSRLQELLKLPVMTARGLVDMALRLGSRDNCTAILVDAED